RWSRAGKSARTRAAFRGCACVACACGATACVAAAGTGSVPVASVPVVSRTSADRDEDLAILDPDVVGPDRPDRGQTERAPRLDVEARAVPRALELAVVQLTRRQREILV